MTSPPDTPVVGQPIANGHYVLKRPIGKGAMGTVWEAVHVALDRRVAVKLLHPHMMERPAIAERFRREAKAASLLKHRNTVQLLDFGQDGPVFYLVMELLEGVDLADVSMDEGALDPLRAVMIMAQVAAALGAAHDKGIVHRDMKPSNIMLVAAKDDDGREVEVVKVLDFGIAKLMQSELAGPTGGAMLTLDGDVCGTPEYMSPEQAEGRELDPRTDLYACGIILYQLLAGDVPFVGDTALATMIMHVAEAPRPLRELNPSVPVELEAIVTRCLAKRREDRYQSARDLRADLLALLRAGGALGVAAAGAASSPAFAPVTTSPRGGNVATAATDERPSLLGARAAAPRRGWARPVIGGLAALGLAGGVAMALLSPPPPAQAPITEGRGLAPAATPPEVGPAVTSPPAVEVVAATAAPDERDAVASPEGDAGAQRAASAGEEPEGDARASAGAVEPTVIAAPAPSSGRGAAATERVAGLEVTPKAAPEAAVKPGGSSAREAGVAKARAVDPAKTQAAPAPEASGPATVAAEAAPASDPRPARPSAAPAPVEVVRPAEPPKPAPIPALVADASEGGWSIDGSLPPSAIQRAVARQHDAVEACYASSARAAQKDLGGAVEVSFVIDVDGQARDVRVGAFGLPGFSECVAAALARVRTRERPDTGTVAAKFHLRLTPRPPR